MHCRTRKTAALTIAALLGVPAVAMASSHQLALFQDDARLVQDDATRTATLDELRSLGVDAIKFQISWSDVAPATKKRPAGFDGSDPGAYPAGRWSRYDALVRNATARGLRVMIAVAGPAPGWATARRGDRQGVDRPSPHAFRDFVEAVGRRYPGVDLWAIWNEPNHPGFLYPQATRRRVPYSPYLYRRLVGAAVSGLRRSGHGGNRILFGEILPIGKTRLFRKNTIKPILFMRELFCLNGQWRAYRGRAARLRHCGGFRRITGVNGFGYHPYTRPNGPRGKEPSSDDATIRSIGRVTRALDIAQRKRRLGGPRRMSVYNTEFGFQSNPPDPYQTPIRRIPGFLSESEWISFRNPRVASYSQYTLFDSPLGDRDRFGTWQGGLYFASGRIKKDVYAAYRLPFFVRRLGRKRVEVWGAARPGGLGAQVRIEQRLGRRPYRSLGGRFAVTNARGYFRKRFRISKASRRTFRFKYLTGSSTFTSRSAKAVLR
jgi:hypothetical protein